MTATPTPLGARCSLRLAYFIPAAVLLIGWQAPEGCVWDHKSDLWHYAQMSAHLIRGERPYQDFALEYPPLSLFSFLLPRLALLGNQTNFAHYVWAFLAVSVLLTLGLALTVHKATRLWEAAGGVPLTQPELPLGLLALLVVVVSPLLPWRYDLFPTLLSALAFAAVLSKRPLWAGIWLGLGIAAKLYPAILVPVFCLYYFTSRQPRALTLLLAGCVGAVVLCFLPFATQPPHVLFSFLRYHELRGLEVESVAAGILMQAHVMGLTPAHVVYNYGALHLVSPSAPAFIRVLPFVFLGFYAAVLLRCRAEFVRDWNSDGVIRPESLVRFLLAVLVAFMLANKVFSPQYVIWLLPFAPLLRPRSAALMVAIFVLTIALYPFGFTRLVSLDSGAVLLLTLRNGLALIFLATLLERTQTREAAPSPALPKLKAAYVPD